MMGNLRGFGVELMCTHMDESSLSAIAVVRGENVSERGVQE